MTTPFVTNDEAWFWAWDQYGTAAAGAPARRGVRHPARPCAWTDIILPVLEAVPAVHHAYLEACGRAGFWRDDPSHARAQIVCQSAVSFLLADKGWLARSA